MIDRGIVVAPFVSCHSEFPPRSAAHSNQYYLISINQNVNPCVCTQRFFGSGASGSTLSAAASPSSVSERLRFLALRSSAARDRISALALIMLCYEVRR